MFEALGWCVHSVLAHVLLALTSIVSVVSNGGVAKRKPLSCSREYQTDKIICQLPEVDKSRPQSRSRYCSCFFIRLSAHSKQAVSRRLAGVVILSICSLAAAQDGGGTHAIASTPASSVHQDTTRHHGFSPVSLSLSLLLLVGTVVGSVWILTRAADRDTFKDQRPKLVMAHGRHNSHRLVGSLSVH